MQDATMSKLHRTDGAEQRKVFVNAHLSFNLFVARTESLITIPAWLNATELWSNKLVDAEDATVKTNLLLQFAPPMEELTETPANFNALELKLLEQEVVVLATLAIIVLENGKILFVTFLATFTKIHVI